MHIHNDIGNRNKHSGFLDKDTNLVDILPSIMISFTSKSLLKGVMSTDSYNGYYGFDNNIWRDADY